MESLASPHVKIPPSRHRVGHAPRFRPDVEGLRAVAVLLVFADHLFGHPGGGFIGVDVFFVISGYLITGLLVRERETKGTVSLREFYARRVRRIMPVAVAVLMLTLLAARLVLTTTRARQAVSDARWALGFLANVHFSHIGTNYFEATRPPSPVQHFWSLSIEEQFYVFWPALLILTFASAAKLRLRRPRLAVGAVALVGTVLSFLWCLHVTAQSPTSAYFSTPARAWELGVGALVTLGQGRLLRVPAGVRAGAGWLGLLGILISAVTFTSGTVFPGVAAAAPVLSTALILGAGGGRGVGSRWPLGSPLFQYVGKLSYSLYLWHWPCIVLARAYYGTRGWEFYLVAGVVPFLLSATSFHLIEDPIRRSNWLSARPRRRRRGVGTGADWLAGHRLSGVRAVYVALAVALVVVSLTKPPTNVPFTTVAGASGLGASPAGSGSLPVIPAAIPDPGIPSGPPPPIPVAQALGVHKWGPLQPSLDQLPSAGVREWADGCLNVEPANMAKCVYGDPNGAKLAVVLGDSMAMSYEPALEGALGPGWRIQTLTHERCPMMLLDVWSDNKTRTPTKACLTHRSWALDQVQALHPDLVLISNWSAQVDEIYRGKPPGDPSNFAKWKNGTSQVLAKLVPEAGKVVLVASPPGTQNLQLCATPRSSPSDCDGVVSGGKTQTMAAEQAAAAANNVTYVDAVDWFCAQNRCPAVISDIPVYFDGSHLTQAYSELLAPYLREALGPLDGRPGT